MLLYAWRNNWDLHVYHVNHWTQRHVSNIEFALISRHVEDPYPTLLHYGYSFEQINEFILCSPLYYLLSPRTPNQNHHSDLPLFHFLHQTTLTQTCTSHPTSSNPAQETSRTRRRECWQNLRNQSPLRTGQIISQTRRRTRFTDENTRSLSCLESTSPRIVRPYLGPLQGDTTIFPIDPLPPPLRIQTEEPTIVFSTRS